jgi:hypothetical protein
MVKIASSPYLASGLSYQNDSFASAAPKSVLLHETATRSFFAATARTGSS